MTTIVSSAAAGVLLDTLPVLHVICAWSLALLLAVAARHKAGDLHVFAAILWNYGMLPTGLVKPAAVMIVLAEMGTAALLCAAPFSPDASFFGGAGAAALMLVYGFAIAINLLRGSGSVRVVCAQQLHDKRAKFSARHERGSCRLEHQFVERAHRRFTDDFSQLITRSTLSIQQRLPRFLSARSIKS